MGTQKVAEGTHIRWVFDRQNTQFFVGMDFFYRKYPSGFPQGIPNSQNGLGTQKDWYDHKKCNKFQLH